MHRDDATRDETLRVSSQPVSGEGALEPLRSESATRGARHLAAVADERLDRLFHSALLSLLGKQGPSLTLPSEMGQTNRTETASMPNQSKWVTEAKRLIAECTADSDQLTDDMRNEIFDRMNRIETMRESEIGLRLALSAAGIGVWRADLATMQVTIDANLSRMAGLDAVETTVPRDELLSIIHPDDRADMTVLGRVNVSGDVVELPDCRFVLPDGRTRWMRTRCCLIRSGDDDPQYATGVSFDVTDLKTSEQSMRRGQEELEARIAERTAELQQANRALMNEMSHRRQEHERLLEAERLAAIGSAMNGLMHESRNALQRSQACLEMLSREVQDRPAARDLIDRIQRAQNDLHDLYERVRDYAAPLRLDPQRHVLSTIVREVWLELEPLRSGRQARLREEYTGSDPACEIDRRAIAHVFSHLLRNSLVICPEPVEISISYHDAEIDGQPAIKIILEDNGPGLPAAEREKAFAPFFTTRTRGTGLGLAVSKRIVEAHGGQISLGAESSAGAQFVLILPRRRLS
jgi:signal transduction histidine kinase/PAS domain-containing protein